MFPEIELPRVHEDVDERHERIPAIKASLTKLLLGVSQLRSRFISAPESSLLFRVGSRKPSQGGRLTDFT